MDNYNAARTFPGKRLVRTLLPGILCAALTASLAAANGADTFKTKCAMCHGADASGNTPMGKQLHIRDLRSAEVQKLSDGELTAIITDGKPPVPAFGKTLSAADIHELVSYLRDIAKK